MKKNKFKILVVILFVISLLISLLLITECSKALDYSMKRREKFFIEHNY